MVVYLPVHDGKNFVYVRIDKSDFNWINQYNWRTLTTPAGLVYIVANINGTRIFLHKLIIGADCSVQVDHKDRDTLNNTRQNLRVATNAENSRNRATRNDKNYTEYKGVYYRPDRPNHWRAQIRIDGTLVHIGTFSSEIDAAKAYNEKASEVWGEFAYLNTIELGI